MKTVSQRELRNNNAALVRGVEQGETYTVTRRGVPVAQLSPIPQSELRCIRPAKKRLTYRRTDRVTTSIPSSDLIDALRGDR